MHVMLVVEMNLNMGIGGYVEPMRRTPQRSLNDDNDVSLLHWGSFNWRWFGHYNSWLILSDTGFIFVFVVAESFRINTSMTQKANGWYRWWWMISWNAMGWNPWNAYTTCFSYSLDLYEQRQDGVRITFPANEIIMAKVIFVPPQYSAEEKLG